MSWGSSAGSVRVRSSQVPRKLQQRSVTTTSFGRNRADSASRPVSEVCVGVGVEALDAMRLPPRCRHYRHGKSDGEHAAGQLRPRQPCRSGGDDRHHRQRQEEDDARVVEGDVHDPRVAEAGEDQQQRERGPQRPLDPPPREQQQQRGPGDDHEYPGQVPHGRVEVHLRRQVRAVGQGAAARVGAAEQVGGDTAAEDRERDRRPPEIAPGSWLRAAPARRSRPGTPPSPRSRPTAGALPRAPIRMIASPATAAVVEPRRRQARRGRRTAVPASRARSRSARRASRGCPGWRERRRRASRRRCLRPVPHQARANA